LGLALADNEGGLGKEEKEKKGGKGNSDIKQTKKNRDHWRIPFYSSVSLLPKRNDTKRGKKRGLPVLCAKRDRTSERKVP